MRARDTIMALSSGAPPSGVAVIRLSGPRVREALSFIAGALPEPRKLVLRNIGHGTALDQGLVAFFPAPHSFTGEDCAELQVHGSPAGIRAILDQLRKIDLRLAEAGEFTRRAFENGKLDLVEIEGLGDLLSAETEGQRRQALARYDGRFSDMIDMWRETLLDLRADLEARLDFSDEGDVGEDLPDRFHSRMSELVSSLQAAIGSITSGRIVREGFRVAVAGAPNAGKSSLINALSRSEIAIVSSEAGTTRDVREVPLDVNGQLFVFLDLAGLRDTDSLAEAEGVRRARQAMETADVVLWLEAPDSEGRDRPAGENVLLVQSKGDLRSVSDSSPLTVSSKTRDGLVDLMNTLSARAGLDSTGEPPIISRERDRAALEEALRSIEEAEAHLACWEIAAEDLRIASAALERLVGRLDPERVLDRLFSSFCIGK